MHVEQYEPGLDSTLDQIVSNLRQVYDPELFTNVYDLGLIYDVMLDTGFCRVTMTLTSAFCPVGDQLYNQVKEACKVPGVTRVDVDMTFEPQWTADRIPFHTKLEMGLV